jgi:dTDP-4-amino-4,6-dideoxygalactose transaminase
VDSLIPFNRPSAIGKEMRYLSQVVTRGHLAGDGPFTKKCHEWLKDQSGAEAVLLVHSCTAALEMAMLLCGVGPGDEVILPSFTFVSTANAIAMRGAEPVFIDIRPDTLNLDETLLEKAITDNTRAVVPVHYAGVGAEMDAVMRIAEKHGLMVVEDAAQAVTSTYKDRMLGTIGDLGCWSFHETKNFISGEGGALVINDAELIERAEMLREKGTDRSRFFRGQVDKYTWVDLGSSFLPSELVAAFLYAQLEGADEVKGRREAIWRQYYEKLEPLSDFLRLPVVPKECRHNAHLFYILLPSESHRDALITHLREQSIMAVFHYLPLHTSPMGQKLGHRGRLPVTEDISARLVRLPCYPALQPQEQDRVIAAVTDYVQKKGTT